MIKCGPWLREPFVCFLEEELVKETAASASQRESAKAKLKELGFTSDEIEKVFGL
tara:strand:+ start:329 stop:493 length:165 start_codon:yes stop_codon:yes gene_type:complete